MFLYTLTSAAFLQAIIKEHTKSAPDQSKPTHQTWAARWEQCDGRQHDGWINMSFWFWWVQLTIVGQQNPVNYGNVLSFVSIANWWVHSDSINPVSLKAIAVKYLEKHKAKQGVYIERMLTHHFAAVWIIKKNHQLKCSLPPKICEVGWGRYSLLGYACWSTCQLGCWPSQDSKYEHCQIDWEPVGGPIKNHQNLRICSYKHLWDSNRVLWGNNIVANFCLPPEVIAFAYSIIRKAISSSTRTPMQSHEPVLRSLRTMAVALTTATQQLQNQNNFASNVWCNLTYCNCIQRLQNP